MLRSLAILILVAAVVYAAVLALLYFRQEALLFYPEPLPQSHRFAVDADVHELTVDVPGARLSVLQLRLPDPRGVVFFLHGNAGNLKGWFSNAALYRRANYDLVMMDYRGYGKSTGRVAGESQLRGDVRAVWDAVAPRYAGRRVVLYGRSLGTALAADLSAQLTAQGRVPHLTVLVSPYSSMGELTGEFYPWVPRALLRYPLDTAAHASRVKGEVLLLHGDRDTLIGVHHARRLAQRLPHARLEVVPGAGHDDIHMFPAYEQAFLRALQAP